MKVVLIKPVPKLGSIGDVKNVADGYARNFLIPNKLVIAGTSTNLREAARLKQLQAGRVKSRSQNDEKLLKVLPDYSPVFKVKTSAEGRLFAGIDAKDIIQRIKTDLKLELTPAHIKMAKPIKEAGEHLIKIIIAKKEIDLKITVKAENEK